MKIIKRDAMSGKPIAGTVFSIKSVTGSYSTSVTTGVDGSATLSSIPADVYVVREESVPEPYIVSNTEQTVALRPGKTSEVTFVDYEKPGLEILKKTLPPGSLSRASLSVLSRSTAAFPPAPPRTARGASSSLPSPWAAIAVSYTHLARRRRRRRKRRLSGRWRDGYRPHWMGLRFQWRS